MPLQEITTRPATETEGASPEMIAFVRQFTVAAERTAQLGQKLKGAAQALVSTGEMLSDDLMAELMAVRAEIQQIRQKVVDLANSLGIATDTLDKVSSLAALQPLLNAVVQAEQQRHEVETSRATALAALNRVLALTHCDDPNFTPLHECQAKAIILAQTLSEGTWKQLPAETLMLARGTHPLCALLKLTEDASALDDEMWAQLLETVATSFSRPLALAAARGRLAAADSPTALSPDGRTETPPKEKPASRSAKDARDKFRFERIALP